MRLNFEFTEDHINDLKALQKKTGTSSMKELFNEALTILEWTIDETIAGNEIAALSEEDKNYRVLITPILKRVAKQHQRETAGSL